MLHRALVGSLVGLIFGLSPVFAFAADPSVCPFFWNSNLKTGTTGASVTKLQQFLDIAPATGYYGPITSRAVSAFQEKYASEILTPNALTAGTGVAGVSTRAKLNILCTDTVVVGEATISAPANTPSLILTVPDQPATTLAPANALSVPFTDITLTAGASDVTVSSITVERVGPSSDSAFADVYMYDDESDVGNIAYFNSKHQATFKDGFTIPAGTSKNLYIVGDMGADLSGNDGEMAGLRVIAINASAPVSGPLPVTGTFQTMNASLVIGSVDILVSGDDPRNERTRYITETGITFSGVRLTAGSTEDLRLTSMTWTQNGSASASDVANIATVVNGISYPAEADGRTYTSTFPDGIVIRKGNSIDISVKGDVTTTGSNRTVQFDIDDGADIEVYGEMYGFGIFPLPGGNTDVSGNSVFLTDTGDTDGVSLVPYFSGSITNISHGAVVGASKI